MSTKPPSRTADQFVVRLPDGMRERIATEATFNGRSMNAEIVTRLQASLEAGPPSFAPEIRISLDTGEEPISWDEIHEIISAIRKKLDINAVSLHVNVETPELVSSSKRERETAELAAKLRPQPYSTKGIQTGGDAKPLAKRMPNRASKKKPE